MLGAADQEVHRTLDWLQERLNYWLNEVRRRQEEVRRAEAALARCQASGYRDRDGHYHAPNCSTQEAALRQAQLRLQEAEAELANVRHWLAVVEQAVAAYYVQEQRLRELTTTHTEKTKAFLGRAVADLERYLAAAPPSSLAAGPSAPTQSDTQGADSGITWAERRAIIAKIDSGQTITPDELHRLQLPVSDLQAGTAADDEAWLNQLLESEHYRETMRDSQEADNLKEALLATMKAIAYWRSKP